MSPYILLGVAIVSEVIGTLALRSADGFTKLVPSIVTIVGYAIAFYFLSLTLKTIPVGVAYAIWSGMGVVLVSILAYFLYKQSLDLAGMLGIGLIVSGVIVLNVFSKVSAH